MKVSVVEQKKVIPMLQVGDMVQTELGGFYMVGLTSSSSDDGDYVLRELDTGHFANGRFKALASLTNTVENLGWKVYPKNKYELKLVKKGS